MNVIRVISVDNDTINICPKCKGRGYTMEEDLMDIYDGPFDEEYRIPCISCRESGRTKTAIVEFAIQVPHNFKVGDTL